jgi:hypothetical protein
MVIGLIIAVSAWFKVIILIDRIHKMSIVREGLSRIALKKKIFRAGVKTS